MEGGGKCYRLLVYSVVSDLPLDVQASCMLDSTAFGAPEIYPGRQFGWDAPEELRLPRK